MPTIKKIKPQTTHVSSAKGRYNEAIGRRKTSIARVRVHKGDADTKRVIEINNKKFEEYFPQKKHQKMIFAPLDAVSLKGVYSTVHVSGGGKSSQAEAVRLGISRVLIALDSSRRTTLKAFGYLTRDPRAVERKKPGLRKARRPQQWRKR